MALIVWEAKFSVGIPELDTEHKKLVQMINALHDAMKLGKGKEILLNLLNECAEYALKHFDHEEKLMDKYNFPGNKEHKDLHIKFVETITNLRKKYDQKALQSGELLGILKDWLIDHICTIDK